MRIMSKQWVQRSTTNNTDQVIAWVPIPHEGKVNGLWLETHVIGELGSSNRATVYNMSGQVIDLNYVQGTPDVDYDWAWDMNVPKDSDAVSSSGAMYDDLSFDWLSSPNTVPVRHPGYLNVEALFQNPKGNVEFFKREKMLTFVNSPSGYDYTSQNYKPTDLVRTKIDFGFGGQVEGAHLGMVGIGNPDMSNTINSVPNLISEMEWAVLGEIERVLDLMYIHALGLADSSSDSPYDAISFFIAKMLEGQIMEEDADTWDTTTSLVTFTKATWDISTPNRGTPKVLSSG